MMDKQLEKWAGYFLYWYFDEKFSFEEFLEQVEAGRIPKRAIVDWSKVRGLHSVERTSLVNGTLANFKRTNEGEEGPTETGVKHSEILELVATLKDSPTYKAHIHEITNTIYSSFGLPRHVLEHENALLKVGILTEFNRGAQEEQVQAHESSAKEAKNKEAHEMEDKFLKDAQEKLISGLGVPRELLGQPSKQGGMVDPSIAGYLEPIRNFYFYAHGEMAKESLGGTNWIQCRARTRDRAYQSVTQLFDKREECPHIESMSKIKDDAKRYLLQVDYE